MWLFLIQEVTYIINLLSSNNSMEQNSSWEANGRSVGYEIPCPLCYPNVHYCVHKSSSLNSILSLINQVYTNISYLLHINFNITFIFKLSSPRWCFPSVLMTNILYEFLLSHIHRIFSNEQTISHKAYEWMNEWGVGHNPALAPRPSMIFCTSPFD
jgi:hypothetical protein